MESKFISEPITYTGAELRGHYIYRRHDLLGDAIISFIGPAKVEEELVDWVDRKKGASIGSPKMLHFLVEHFGISLQDGVWRLRHLITIASEQVGGRHRILRDGNDLYVGKRKLSVAIATASPTSVVMHVGINVETKGTPVPAVGLKELKVEPKKFARNVMKEYIMEVKRMQIESSKVRGVPEVI